MSSDYDYIRNAVFYNLLLNKDNANQEDKEPISESSSQTKGFGCLHLLLLIALIIGVLFLIFWGIGAIMLYL